MLWGDFHSEYIHILACTGKGDLRRAEVFVTEMLFIFPKGFEERMLQRLKEEGQQLIPQCLKVTFNFQEALF